MGKDPNAGVGRTGFININRDMMGLAGEGQACRQDWRHAGRSEDMQAGLKTGR